MIAITNGKILTMNGSSIQGGTVLIDGGKIVEVGPMETIDIPQTAKIIDAGGRLVTPGFIDVHTHLGIDEEGIGWEGDDYNETSDAVTPHVRAIDGINPYDRGFHDAARAGITAVQVLPGSANVIGGLMCCLKVKPGSTVDEMVIKDPSGLKIALGENPKKYHGKQGRAPQTRMGAAALIREQFVQSQNYLLKLQRGEAERDLRMEALGLALGGTIPVRVHVHRADDIMTAIRIAKEFGLNMTLEHVTEGHKVAKFIAEAGVSAAVGPTLTSRSKVELKDKGWETYAVLADHGVQIAITTDHPVIPIEHLLTSAGAAVQAGLPEEEAWKALTIHAAKHIGIDNRVGSIEAGKDADLVIWSGHPFVGFAHALYTIVDGQIIYSSV